MSSFTRRIELKLLRQRKLIPARHKAVARKRGQPYRNCKVTYNEAGDIVSWVRYH